MDSIDDVSYWDFLDYSNIIGETANPDFILPTDNFSDGVCGGGGGGAGVDFGLGVDAGHSPSRGGGCVVNTRKNAPERGVRLCYIWERNNSCSRAGSKASREKLRRERLNDRFFNLISVLEPGRPARTDKPAILDDAIRVLSQLKNEAQELKETNEKLLEEVKSLKAEKNELREEKVMLKIDNERIEKQLKSPAFPSSGFMPSHPAAYNAGPNKMPVYPSYSLIPMWRYLPPATRDTSHDHELRPPAA